MSGKANRAEDPFAGYTPVKSALPVVDGDVPVMPQPVRHRSKKRKAGGNVLQAFGRFLMGIVSVVLIVVVAAVTYGFIYGRPTADMSPELVFVLDYVRPLTDFGNKVRAKAREIPVLRSLDRTEDRRSSAAEASLGVSASVMNVVLQKERMRIAQNIADGADVTGAEKTTASALPAGVVRPDSRPGTRRVDPKLKEFRTGGRAGRPLR